MVVSLWNNRYLTLVLHLPSFLLLMLLLCFVVVVVEGEVKTLTTMKSCDDQIKDVSTWLDPHGRCGAQPSCSCGYDDQGNLYAECKDTQRQCYSADLSVCGFQYARKSIDDHVGATGGSAARYLYTWRYDGVARDETLRYYLWNDGSCSFTIADSSGLEIPCSSCGSAECSDGKSAFYVDCSNYEIGATANGCFESFGVHGGVLQGFVITDGHCVPGEQTPRTSFVGPLVAAAILVAILGAYWRRTRKSTRRFSVSPQKRSPSKRQRVIRVPKKIKIKE